MNERHYGLLFDTNWYLERNPDVAAAHADPIEHYIKHGAWEGRDPHPLFDTDWYLSRNPDIAANVNPLIHFLQKGGRQGRDPHPLFNSGWYLEKNPDVAVGAINPLLHYLNQGAMQGRDPHPLFDSDWYLERNPDVAANAANPLRHYLEYGAREGRDPHPLFDSDWYLKKYPDVAAGTVNPLQHYVEHGANEGRDPHPLFNTDWYKHHQINPSSKANPLVHYITVGGHAGLDPSPSFDTAWYRSQFKPHVSAEGNALLQYLTSDIYEQHLARSTEAMRSAIAAWSQFSSIDPEFRTTIRQADVPNLSISTGNASGGKLGAWTIFFRSIRQEYQNIFFAGDPAAKEITKPLSILIDAAHRRDGPSSTLIIVTDASSRDPQKSLPEGTHWRFLDGSNRKLGNEERLELVTAIIHSLQPEVVMNANSIPAWEAIARYGGALSSDSRIFALLTTAHDNTTEEWASRADYYLRACGNYLHGIYFETPTLRDKFAAQFGFSPSMLKRTRIAEPNGGNVWQP